MIENKFDLFVIGGGSGGVRAARVASSNGLKVGLAEGWDLGGTCVNRGCVPKKLYAYASHIGDDFDLIDSFGWSITKKKFSWKKLVNNKKKELSRLNDIYSSLLTNSGVKIFKGYASFLNPNSIKIGNKIINAKKFLIAVGTKPRKLDFLASDEIITSDEAFDLKKLPKSIMILGGGYIAVEFASIFNGLGVDTTICIRGKKILKGFDDDVVEHLMNNMKRKGVKFITEEFPQQITKKSNLFYVNFKKSTPKKFNLVMEAVGRQANIENLNLKVAKIKISKNSSIIVNDYFETSNKDIYAIGDVIDRIQLTPVAIAEAMTLVQNFKRKKKEKFSYNNVPTAVFSNPNFACVGYTETEAKRKFKNIEVFKSNFRPLKFSLSDVKEKIFLKLITNKSNNKVIGLHYLGENAAEIIQGFSVAVVNGLKKSDFDKTIGIHPSSAEEIVTLKK
ncbi:MAG: glutathione-disulfide reductase [Pelagibacteraceae bacterium TMED124]|nr:glutathione-disulfide reductase [Rickettsiales bacterium]RPG16360.1 MAG: glutathione-disulfide reductase [Pelagibacteraceae bacterium TMED124]|tara:strand:+ start:1448 stop:2791 length:1344 start_codon:yes stop_codon:yes gene_type:complete